MATTTTDEGRMEGGYTYDSFTGVGSQARKPTERHFLWWCSGAYQGLLKDCPSEQTKYAGLGGVLLATFVLAALSAGYAIYSVFADPVWAVLFALIWGLIIFNFDRFLVSTMRKYGVSQRKQLWMAAPRLALALLIGFTIARPLELKIFEKEIDVQLAANRHQKLLMNDSLLQAENRTTLAAAQQERDRLSARKAALEDTLHQLQQDYIREADGTGGSQRRGIDKLTRLKQQAFESALRQFTPELRQLEGQMRYQDSLIAGANAGRDLRNRQYEAQVTADVGFLERNKALSDLSAHEPSVFWANLLLSLLIILIETGPILSKMIMNTGPYDLALASMELKQMAAAEDGMRRDKELRHEKQQEVNGRQKEMTAELLQQLSALQKKHVKEELDQWERGEDTVPKRMPLEEVTRRIKERYSYRGGDIL
ncbi:DUF4407 domain-containing protein [Puia dinghuensis]|uniref:DUF4407 domain-containing protein n=1 Tax=Puia dinghuensis TaxID=1792502 RepID=A0A8J2U788_9BACT|nr:DUF4407 domain-containing protein [Puia dinghuensis]GGA83070.1 hypothetical protein GCM10011511_02620 [Puia dinghuensis]